MSDRNGLLPALAEDGAAANGAGIADRLASSIALGVFSLGERLPTEVDLARQFGVAVATLRKALATLREHGLVETRRGRFGGTFVVRAPFPSDGEAADALARAGVVDLRDLHDEYVAVGSAVAGLAATRAVASGVDGLAEVAARMPRARTAPERATADSRFHIELAVLAQSPRLLRSLLRLQSEVSSLYWSGAVTGTDVTVAGAVHAEHLGIVEAVRAGNAHRAERLMTEHVHDCVYRLIDAKIALGREPVATERSTR
ncbi:FCD domain-containing protein [Pseudonocardia nematodicida]|uniref:FCD domain-containing protein n=1 Tax=Pseudonocardia nematodicida TaxID=1206997 RepID=A0ABV1K588_9PSEU